MAQSTHRKPSAKKVSATNLRSFRSFLLMQQFAAREIGARIAQARLEAGGMTQVELADALNVSTRSVQDYEAGVTIPWKQFERLEQIFGRPLAWFLHGDEAASATTPEGDLLAQAEARHKDVLGAVEELRVEVRALIAALAPGEAHA